MNKPWFQKPEINFAVKVAGELLFIIVLTGPE